jgi:radial spoke head protein 3
MAGQAGNEFSYTSEPHAAPVKAKGKYRDENEDVSGNLMSDPRVVRGSTYAAKVTTQDDVRKQSKGAGRRMRRGMGGGTRRSGTPPPVPGRSHMDMQTDDVLEELTDKPVELDMETQTPAVYDRPPSPLFVKAKIGHDMETQILSGDLFNFDLEVEPILEVLVGKTLHVSMLEIMQEEELNAIALQQAEFETVRNIELAEVQRLEADIKRKAMEKERRVEQESKRKIARRALEEKIAARSFSQQYLGGLHQGVFDTLIEEGFLYDPVRKEVEDLFMAGMIDNLKKQADAYVAAQSIASDLLNNTRITASAYAKEAVMLREAHKEKLARLAAEEAARLAAEAEAAAAAAAEGGEEAEEE